MNKSKILSNLLLAIPVGAILCSAFFMNSCANTTEAPSGGDKDTIPPHIVNITPYPGTTNVPVHGLRIAITFNEYVKVKDPKSIFLSPPQKKNPKYKMRDKTLIVYFEDDLDSNTTYTLDLTNAIVDNNEENLFPGYTYVFSTGSVIDSMCVTGTVLDSKTLTPVKGATVMLYKDMADSAIFLHTPDAAMKTDAWGYFAIRNIGSGPYRIYALMDESSNNIFDPESDQIGFELEPFSPTIVVRDTLKELLKYDMLDTLNCQARKSEHELRLYRERGRRQVLLNSKRTSEYGGYFTFQASDAKIDSMWIKGVRPERIIAQQNIYRDSFTFWIYEPHRKKPRRGNDTLNVYVDYLKTDTSGKLAPFVEHLKLIHERKPENPDTKKARSHADSVCKITVNADPKMVEQNGISIRFTYPLIREGFNDMVLTATNPRQQVETMKFTVERDSLDLLHYTVRPNATLARGYTYNLKIKHHTFRDITGFQNDSTEASFSLPKDDDLSTMRLELTGVHTTYIVELLTEKKNEIQRSYTINSDSTLAFPYLSKGKYCIRIIEDANGNGIVDSGSLFDHRQCEKVLFYKGRNGLDIIEVDEGMEIIQKINLEKLFSK